MKIFINTIMKNEADNIDQFYNSCKEADGIFVLDTGSTDGSVEKLKSMGSNVIVDQKIYDTFSFDVARNDAIKLLPKEDAWVINLDMDEFLVGNWKEELSSLDAKYNIVNYLYAFDHTKPENAFLTNKIARNGTYIWKNPIHEIVELNTGVQTVSYLAKNFQIHQKQDQKKQRNYKDRLESCLKTHPNYEIARFYLLKEYFTSNEYGKAIDLSKMVFNSGLNNDYKMVTWLLLYRCFIAMESSIAKLENCLYQAYLLCPYRREPYVDMMRFYTQHNMPEMVFWAGTNALAITKRNFDFIEMVEAWTEEPYHLYTRACQMLGYDEVARKAFSVSKNIISMRGHGSGNPHSYSGLRDLLNYINKPISILEIGSYAGESTQFFANSDKVLSVTSVDPWQDGEKCEHVEFNNMTIVESLFDDRVGNNKKVTKIKAKIEDIEIPVVDMVYIDATHTYEDVKKHIEIVKNKAKYIAGHDYSDAYPGVKKAVNEFADENQMKIVIFRDTSWMAVKE